MERYEASPEEWLLAALSLGDWITLSDAFVRDAVSVLTFHGYKTFYIQYGAGWSGRAVADILRGAGIQTWGHMVASPLIGASDWLIMITVPGDKASFAASIMGREGVPYYEGDPAHIQETVELIERGEVRMLGLGE